MYAILGIDAAWTTAQPSGVAIVVRDQDKWRLRTVAPSYTAFLDETFATDAVPVKHRGASVEAAALLTRANALAGCEIDLVAIDMPLSKDPITARRISDNLVSSAYGARHCATHTPSALRPGRISDDIRLGFARAGYDLLTDEVTTPGLIEVYPHPALVELSRAERRLPYKFAKVRKYWPDETPAVRRIKLMEAWQGIIQRLDAEIGGVATAMKMPSSSAKGWELKAFEDMMDAIVCAWIGITVLEGRAMAYGDSRSAIWIPGTSP